MGCEKHFNINLYLTDVSTFIATYVVYSLSSLYNNRNLLLKKNAIFTFISCMAFGKSTKHAAKIVPRQASRETRSGLLSWPLFGSSSKPRILFLV